MNQELNPSLSSLGQPRTYMAVLVVLAATHPLNDLIQSLIPAVDAAGRHLNFSRATDELGLTPATISYQIKEIEDRLGFTLRQVTGVEWCG